MLRRICMGGALDDTICAVATPVGEGGIGIVRISGPHSLAVAEKVIRLRSNLRLGDVPSHTLHLADILSPSSMHAQNDEALDQARTHSEEFVDEAMVVFMAKPRSFTAEDVVEIHCHGSSIITGLVCEACLAAGARLAQPGEFTKRAFLNGRLDLTQAEAVLDTIRARSEAGLKSAQRHLRGDLGRLVGALRSRLVTLLAHVEAGIDFIGEDISFVQREEMRTALSGMCQEIKSMLLSAERGRQQREGARVVIVGRPNVGKSSLLNSLLGEERAIVTDIPGTTRDIIEESVVWNGIMITLVDTAGLRETTDVVEQEGIKRTKAALDDGDLVLHVLDGGELEGGDSVWGMPLATRREEVVILNKSDVVDPRRMVRMSRLVEERMGRKVIVTSVRTGTGLDLVRDAIQSWLAGSSWEPNDGAVVTNVRHRHALERARASVEEALHSIDGAAEPEFVALDLREAADALGEVTGEITSEEILNKIFSEFCIGK